MLRQRRSTGFRLQSAGVVQFKKDYLDIPFPRSAVHGTAVASGGAASRPPTLLGVPLTFNSTFALPIHATRPVHHSTLSHCGPSFLSIRLIPVRLIQSNCDRLFGFRMPEIICVSSYFTV